MLAWLRKKLGLRTKAEKQQVVDAVYAKLTGREQYVSLNPTVFVANKGCEITISFHGGNVAIEDMKFTNVRPGIVVGVMVDPYTQRTTRLVYDDEEIPT